MTENEKLQKAIEEEKELYEIMKDRYEKLGVESCRDRVEEHGLNIKWLEEIQQYRAIGTIEEFNDLKEKNTKKRFNIFESHGMRQFVCGYCDRPILTTDNYCSFCGQKLDWQ